MQVQKIIKYLWNYSNYEEKSHNFVYYILKSTHNLLITKKHFEHSQT